MKKFSLACCLLLLCVVVHKHARIHVTLRFTEQLNPKVFWLSILIFNLNKTDFSGSVAVSDEYMFEKKAANRIVSCQMSQKKIQVFSVHSKMSNLPDKTSVSSVFAGRPQHPYL